jgi:enoyl-CoA hydratase
VMIAAMCDLIVASDDAVFSNPIARMGSAGAELLVEPWELGVRKAKEFLWLGDTLTANEARELGLVNRVVSGDDLTSTVDQLAARIAALPPVTARLIKRSLNATLDAMGQRASWDYHFMIHQLGHSTEEYRQILELRRTLSSKEFVTQRDHAPKRD